MSRPTRSIQTALPIILLLVAVVLTVLGPSAAQSLRRRVEWLFAPVSDGMGMMYLSLELQVDEERISQEAAAKLLAKTKQLEHRLAAVENANMKYRDLHRRAQLLSQLFQPARDLPVRLIPAEVVAGDSMPYSWGRLINAGRNKKLDKEFWVTNRIMLTDRAKKLPKNWAVLSGSVVVGRIVESAAYSSRLQLVTDKGFLAVGQIQRVIDGRDVQIGPKLVKLSPQNATMVPVRFKGDGKGAVLIESVKRSHNIRVGDRLVTSPANPLLPMTAMVGKVTRVAEHKDPNWVTLEVQPGVDLAAIREVMVIQPRVAPPAVKGGE